MMKTLDTLKPGAKVYFVGIAGVGMSSAAGLIRQAGFKVLGSDNNVFPPTSHMLEDLAIPVLSPYSKENILKSQADIYVIGNSHSIHSEEVRCILDHQLPYTSFPALIGELFLRKRTGVVVTGTHGKTTTTSLITHMCQQLGLKPGFLIGGLPQSAKESFNIGEGELFIIEGDEYDTAFFDKESKFLHYFPYHLLINNIEFDHADIFPDVDAIKAMFSSLVDLVPQPKMIVANIDNEHVKELITKKGLLEKITTVSPIKNALAADFMLVESSYLKQEELWHIIVKTREWGTWELKTPLLGEHNVSNILHALACVLNIVGKDAFSESIKSKIISSVRSFLGVKRRLEKIGGKDSIEIYEDFAHHPTSIRCAIESLRSIRENSRIVVAFEPRSASSRRNVFQDGFAETLREADVVLLAPAFPDPKLTESQRLDTSVLAKKIGDHAHNFKNHEDILFWMQENLRKNDTVLFMSCGSFSGIQHKLASIINDKK